MSKGVIFLLLGFLMLVIELFFWEYENQNLKSSNLKNYKPSFNERLRSWEYNLLMTSFFVLGVLFLIL
jgi:hypothetical protein